MKKYLIVASGFLLIITIYAGCAREMSRTNPFDPQNVTVTGGGGGGSGSDSYTKVMYHFEGADSSTTITDDSGNSHNGAVQLNAQIKTAQKRFGSSSLRLSGPSIPSASAPDIVTIPNSSDLDFGAGDFTIDCWFRLDALTGQQAIFAGNTDHWLAAWFVHSFSGHTDKIFYYASSNGTTWDLFGTSSTAVGSISITANAWHHFAFVRHGNVWTGYIDGQQDYTTTAAGTLIAKSEVKRIGLFGDGSWSLVGYIDEFRISKGIARWTANFTPPTAAY